MASRRERRHAERLGRVVDSLPYETQRAMLDGLSRYERIIAGAYSDRSAGASAYGGRKLM